MKSLRLHSLILVIAVFSTVSIGQHDHSGHSKAAVPTSENSKLLDEFGQLPHCDTTGRYDVFLAELAQNPETQGYIMIYQGGDVLPANYDSPVAERMFRNHMMFRGFDPSRVTLINGGFRGEGMTQLWIVPPGAVPPSPEDSFPKPEIPTDKTFLFDRGYLGLEEEDQEKSEYVLPSYKAEQEAEQKKLEEEYRMERIAAGEQDVDVEPVQEDADPSEVEPDGSDGLTEEEELEYKFRWISDSFGALLAKRTESRGVIIFYGDDQRFDIQKIHALVAEGVDRVGKSASLNGSRIEIVFGGYRASTNVEFWVVPEKGKAPVPTPEEREVAEPEEGSTEH